jgi:hypothetical protein
MWAAQQAENAKAAGLGELGAGYDTARTEYGKAGEDFVPLKDLFGKGAGLYADVLGVNGAEGSARGSAAFHTSPGYNFARDEALQAVLRNKSAVGELGSGGAMTALQDRASGLAQQDFGNWRTALGGYNPLYAGAVESGAGIKTKLGDLAYGYGRDRAGITTDSAKQVTEAGLAGLQAGQNASQNKWNFGMQLGNTLASLAMGSMGKGGMFGAGGAFAPGGKFA